jgi:transposase
MNASRQARQRAEVILQVRAGRISAAQGARVLGISRKSYYQWEQRGLSAMLRQLQDRAPGRPAPPREPQKQRLRRELSRLKQRLTLLEQTAKLRGRLRQWERQDAKKNAKA